MRELGNLWNDRHCNSHRSNCFTSSRSPLNSAPGQKKETTQKRGFLFWPSVCGVCEGGVVCACAWWAVLSTRSQLKESNGKTTMCQRDRPLFILVHDANICFQHSTQNIEIVEIEPKLTVLTSFSSVLKPWGLRANQNKKNVEKKKSFPFSSFLFAVIPNVCRLP